MDVKTQYPEYVYTTTGFQCKVDNTIIVRFRKTNVIYRVLATKRQIDPVKVVWDTSML